MYSRQVEETVFTFGTSGFLYQSNKLMYDRETGSLWSQFLGKPVVGPLADSGLQLQVLPVVLTTWAEWVRAHPDTTVLSIKTGIYPQTVYRPEEDPFSAYFGYRNSPDALFPVWRRSALLPTKALVLGLSIEGHPKAYPLEALEREPVVNDTLGGRSVVIVTAPDAGAARAYERGTHTFSPGRPGDGAGSVVLVDEAGRLWRAEEDGLVQEANPLDRLLRLPSHMAYWFGWYAFHPTTEVYRTG